MWDVMHMIHVLVSQLAVGLGYLDEECVQICGISNILPAEYQLFLDFAEYPFNQKVNLLLGRIYRISYIMTQYSDSKAFYLIKVTFLFINIALWMLGFELNNFTKERYYKVLNKISRTSCSPNKF